MMSFREKISKIVDSIFAENFTCNFCNCELPKDDKYNLCDDCKAKIVFIGSHACEVCGGYVLADSTVCSQCKNTKRMVGRNYSVIMFSGESRMHIHNFKYKHKAYLKTTFGNLLLDKYREIKKEYDPDIIIPVPLHKNRENERGYNQVDILLKVFDIDRDRINTNCLERIADTPQQANMNKYERMENVAGAFQVVDKDVVKGKSILIVDDIYTTGATIDECAKVLTKAGAKEVRSMTLAHAHRDYPLGYEENDKFEEYRG